MGELGSSGEDSGGEQEDRASWGWEGVKTTGVSVHQDAIPVFPVQHHPPLLC